MESAKSRFNHNHMFSSRIQKSGVRIQEIGDESTKFLLSDVEDSLLEKISGLQQRAAFVRAI